MLTVFVEMKSVLYELFYLGTLKHPPRRLLKYRD